MYFFKGAVSRERFGFFKQVKKIGQNKAALLIKEEKQLKVYHVQAETLFWSSRSGQISLRSSQPCKRKADSLVIQSF
jgi:hypothetical protein